MNEHKITDESEGQNALTVEEYDQVKALFAKGIFDLELEGEDLVLYAECVMEPEDISSDLSQFLANAVLVKAIGRVTLKTVIANSIQSATDEKDDEASRDALFAISGRLRELAGLVEQEAVKLDETEWDIELASTIEPSDEEEESSADED
jgi:hypothetical protein